MIDHVLIFNTESGGLLYSCPADTYKGGDDPEVKALAAEYSCDGIEVHMGRPNDTLATCRARCERLKKRYGFVTYGKVTHEDFQPGISAVAVTEEILMDARQAVERAKENIPPNQPMAPLVVACDAMLEAAELLHKRLLANFT